jgi:hypothetical protein
VRNGTRLGWRGVLLLAFGTGVLGACGPPNTPLALPSQVSMGPRGDVTVDVWVFGVDGGDAPEVVTDGTQLRSAQWVADRPGLTPVGARELQVVMVRAEGTFTVNGSNAIEFSAGNVEPVLRGPARAVSWTAGSRTVAVLKAFPSSVQLVTAAGARLASDTFDCRLVEEGTLKWRVTLCTVRAASPLSGEDAPVRRVRGRVEDLGDVELTNEVDVP